MQVWFNLDFQESCRSWHRPHAKERLSPQNRRTAIMSSETFWMILMFAFEKKYKSNTQNIWSYSDGYCIVLDTVYVNFRADSSVRGGGGGALLFNEWSVLHEYELYISPILNFANVFFLVKTRRSITYFQLIYWYDKMEDQTVVKNWNRCTSLTALIYINHNVISKKLSLYIHNLYLI